MKYTIEYYPNSNRYYVKHGGEYLRVSPLTGLVELTDVMSSAISPENKDQCMELIKLHKEQFHKVGVLVTEVD